MTVVRADLDAMILEVLGTTLDAILNPLLYFLREYGSFPFSFSEPPRRFRTTVQATCLLSLSRTGLLDKAEERRLQEATVQYKDSWHPAERDFAGGLDPPKKNNEDENAWCVTETPSVWSTSYAIWALLSSGYQDKTHIWPAIDWLIRQQHEQTGGFAYQKYKDCIPTVYLTCLAIKALRAALGTRTLLEKKEESIPTLQSAIGRGLDFILSCSRKTDGIIVFAQHPNLPQDRFDWINTIWAYKALNQNDHPSTPNPQLLFHILQKELKDEEKLHAFWRNNGFVIEGHTKYGEQKTYFYFMPSLLIPLINLGLDPLDSLCAYFLREIRQTFGKIGWPIPEYRRTELCTFSTALALQTIYVWASRVPATAINRLLNETKQRGIDNEQTTQLRECKRKYERLTQRCFSLTAFIPALILLLVTPWQTWITVKNPYFIVVATLEVVLCLVGIRLFLGRFQRPWRSIVEMIGLLAGIATIVYIVWSLL